jgi:hypothetical protein
MVVVVVPPLVVPTWSVLPVPACLRARPYQVVFEVNKIEWGMDLGSEHERYLVEKAFPEEGACVCVLPHYLPARRLLRVGAIGPWCLVAHGRTICRWVGASTTTSRCLVVVALPVVAGVAAAFGWSRGANARPRSARKPGTLRNARSSYRLFCLNRTTPALPHNASHATQHHAHAAPHWLTPRPTHNTQHVSTHTVRHGAWHDTPPQAKCPPSCSTTRRRSSLST